MNFFNVPFLVLIFCFVATVPAAAPHNLFNLSNVDFSDHEEEGSVITMQETTPTIINKSDLYGSFSNFHLLSLHIQNSQLSSYNFLRAGLANACIEKSTLNGSTFQETEMPTSKLFDSSFNHCIFSRANLFEVEIDNHCNFTKASFLKSDISFGSIKNSTVEGATFTKCDFLRSTIQTVNFTNASFIDCRFSRTHLKNLDFSHTIMHNPRFFKATLTNVTFAHSTTLQHADFRKSKLLHVNFDEVDLRNTRFTGVHILEGTSFKNAKIDATTEATPKEIVKLVKLGAIIIPHENQAETPHHAKRVRYGIFP